jgi:hypothetical protein
MASDRNLPSETDEGTGLAMPAGDMSEWAEALVAQARTDGIELTGEGGLLTGLIRQVLQTGLEVEMADTATSYTHCVATIARTRRIRIAPDPYSVRIMAFDR